MTLKSVTCLLYGNFLFLIPSFVQITKFRVKVHRVICGPNEDSCVLFYNVPAARESGYSFGTSLVQICHPD